MSDVHLALVDDPTATVERDLDGTLLEARAPSVTPDIVRAGRRFTATAVARRPGLVLSVIWLGLVALAALRPTLLTSRDPLGVEGAARLRSPSWSHLFGTDQLGRDLYSRVVHGAALSMKAALLAVVVGLVIGSLIGLVSGFTRGWVDDAIMRLVDVILSIPALLLALALITVLGFGTYNVALAVGLASIVACARVMRSEVMRVSQSPFVEAAGANGARWSSVLLRHVLPNSLGPVIVLAALEFGTAILAIASLSFLGYGAQPPTPEWGSLVSTGRDFLREAWWLTTMPGLTVAASVLAANRIARALDAGRGTVVSERPLLEVTDLQVRYQLRGGTLDAVAGVDLTLAAGEVLALVGESGSGKSTTAHAIAGLLPPAATVVGGSAHFDGVDLTTLGERRLRAIRGRQIGVIPQDPTVSLNPVKRIGVQVAEVLRIHGLADRRTAAISAVEALDRAGIPHPDARARQYPHELSGGMRQRVLIAIAIAAGPRLVIADEPTSALDVTVQRQILDHIAELTTASGAAVLLITHDLGIAAERADRIAVMSGGRIVEVGRPDEVLVRPRDDYTRTLIVAAPSLTTDVPSLVEVRARPGVEPAPTTTPIIEAHGLVKTFTLPHADTSDGVVRAVDGVDVSVRRGRTLALVGESGSGKSTTARLLLRLVDPTGGTIHFDGTDVTTLRGRPLRDLRRRMQLVYQNPYTSLNPRFTVAQLVADPLRSFGLGTRRQRRQQAAELLDLVALPASALDRKAFELSGGQRQRVAIAAALALRPDLVVLDEPVSALDVSVQSQILELLADLQDELGLSYVFISHDLAVVRHIAHDVAVMHDGRVVERGPTRDVFERPTDAYTRQLLEAIPGHRATPLA